MIDKVGCVFSMAIPNSAWGSINTTVIGKKHSTSIRVQNDDFFERILNLAKNTAKFLIKDKRQLLLIFITMFSGAYIFLCC